MGVLDCPPAPAREHCHKTLRSNGYRKRLHYRGCRLNELYHNESHAAWCVSTEAVASVGRPVPGVPVERTDPAATVIIGRSLSIVMSFPLSPVGATPHSDRPSGGSTPARTCGPRCARPIGHQQMRQGQWAAAHIPRM